MKQLMKEVTSFTSCGKAACGVRARTQAALYRHADRDISLDRRRIDVHRGPNRTRRELQHAEVDGKRAGLQDGALVDAASIGLV